MLDFFLNKLDMVIVFSSFVKHIPVKYFLSHAQKNEINILTMCLCCYTSLHIKQQCSSIKITALLTSKPPHVSTENTDSSYRFG